MTTNYSNIIYGYTSTPSGNHSFLPLRTYNGKTRPHEGVDIPAAEGTSIHASVGGEVVWKAFDANGWPCPRKTYFLTEDRIQVKETKK